MIFIGIRKLKEFLDFRFLFFDNKLLLITRTNAIFIYVNEYSNIQINSFWLLTLVELHIPFSIPNHKERIADLNVYLFFILLLKQKTFYVFVLETNKIKT